MTNPFEVLSRFLDHYGDEVEGRGLEEMPADFRAKISEFAKGRLGKAEREELILALKENPRWVSALAEEAKSARGGTSV